MKKLNDLKAERGELIDKMSTIIDELEVVLEEVAELEGDEPKEEDEEVIENSQKTISEKRSTWTKLNERLVSLDENIKTLERQEELNKNKVKDMNVTQTRTETPTISVQFRDWLKDAVESGKNASFRADPIITTTQTGVINKEVANSVDILTSPAEAWLRQLGVTFFPGLTGNFVVPSMAQDTAVFMLESSTAESANMAHDALTLTARRVTHSQSISRETLAQTNPAIYNSILQNLVNGVWNAVTNDVFDQLETDAATQKSATTAAGLVYGDIVKMEASIGGLNIGSGAYVTTPTTKAYLKQKALLGTDNGPVWGLDNTVNGYPAYGVPAANAGKLYFGDFSRAAVGSWDSLEIIIDPYTSAKKGQIDLTIIGLFDTGITNKRAFCWADVSAGL